MRKTFTGVQAAQGGCWICGGSDAMWTAKNAVAVAARHHDATGHPTWAEQVISISYGERLDTETVKRQDARAAIRAGD